VRPKRQANRISCAIISTVQEVDRIHRLHLGCRMADEFEPNSHFKHWQIAGTSSPRCSLGEPLLSFSARTEVELENRFSTATLTGVTIAEVVTGSS
jgi:hypothetical protein